MGKFTGIAFGAAALLVLCGCVSFEYKGEKETPTQEGSVRLFEDPAKIKRSYSVLGEAKVSGNYQDVSRDRMVAKLLKEAQECGADGVLIVEQQVIPVGGAKRGAGFMTAYDYDSTNRSWSQLYRDVDQNFANPRRPGVKGSEGASNDFKRMIRAEFIKYNK